MFKTWRLPETSAPDLFTQLCWNRQITEAEQARWLAPDYDRDLHDPFLLKDLRRAVGLVWNAVTAGEKIIIFADYDADGVPGAVVLAEFFKTVGYANYDVYIPHRHEEDYGLSVPALEQLAADGAQLIITVDCGISNVAEVARAKALGLTVIITDHHLPPAILPAAEAILNPKQPGDDYPEKMLCGAGVAFKLVQGLVREAPAAYPLPAGWEKWLLDLVALATVSDMVSLRGENRALVYFGLKVLRQTRRPGLLSLYRLLKLTPRWLSEDDVGFSLGPRINSASRMSHASEAFALLSTADPVQALALAEHLERKNQERKTAVTGILASVGTETDARPLFVQGSLDWNLGVIGLAAARLVEQQHRPVFLWGKNGQGLIKGSCRSDGSVNMVALMRAADDLAGAAGAPLFVNYGGHAGAGGFSLAADRVSELAGWLASAYQTLVSDQSVPSPALLLDYPLRLANLNEETYAVAASLAPYGLEHPKPLFLLPRLRLVAARTFGQDRAHLELTVADAERSAKVIGFFQGHGFNPGLIDHPLIDLAVNLEKSYFRGRPELRWRLVDWRPASSAD